MMLRMSGSLDDQVLIALHQAAVTALRPGIVVVSADAATADRVTGSRARTYQSLHRHVRAGRAVAVRRDLLVLRNAIGVAHATLLDLVDAITPGDYLVTGAEALRVRGLLTRRPDEVAILLGGQSTNFGWARQSTLYLRVSPARVWGGARIATGSARPGPMVAQPERALLDAVTHERFGVAADELADLLERAIAEDPAIVERLAEAAHRLGVAAVTRRARALAIRVAGSTAKPAFRSQVA